MADNEVEKFVLLSTLRSLLQNYTIRVKANINKIIKSYFINDNDIESLYNSRMNEVINGTKTE